MFEINGYEWYLKFVEPYSIELQRDDGSYTVGMCNNTTKTIYIDSTLHGRFLKKVLCHEVAHAAMFSYGVDLKIEQEEIIVDIIATYGEEILKITNKLFKKLKYERLL